MAAIPKLYLSLVLLVLMAGLACAQNASKDFDEYARSRTAPRFDARADYRFHKHFAAEADLRRFDESQLDGRAEPDAEGWSLTANAKGYPLTGRLQPYGLLGFGLLHAKLRDALFGDLSAGDSQFITRFGGGADFYATPNLVLNLDVSYLLAPSELNISRDESVRPQLIPIILGFRYSF